jgi:Flp pilus assembly protein TadG
MQYAQSRLHAPGRANSRRRGQSLVEFAIVLPVMLIVLLVAIDFGRVFLGWVTLNNSARIAANFAADNPNAWSTARPDLTAQAEYISLVKNEATAINCTLPNPIPTPTFPSGTDVGAPAQVSFTCQFQILTPLISSVLPNPLPVTASAAFPVAAGAIAGIPVQTPVPTPTPTSTPTPTPTPTSTPTPTPTPMCVVPDLTGVNTKDAPAYWGPGRGASIAGAGFTTSLEFNPQVSSHSNYTIGHQTETPGVSLPCDTTFMTVSP